MIYDNIGQLIGRTPLVRLHLNNPEIKAELLAKVESFNPGGSIKDRVGAYMLLDAEEKTDTRRNALMNMALSIIALCGFPCGMTEL